MGLMTSAGLACGSDAASQMINCQPGMFLSTRQPRKPADDRPLRRLTTADEQRSKGRGNNEVSIEILACSTMLVPLPQLCRVVGETRTKWVAQVAQHNSTTHGAE